MKAIRLMRIDLTVTDLPRAERFYAAALGFERVSAGELDPSLAALLGATSVREIVLRRHGQEIALQAFDPAGAPYDHDATACDQSFQHFAMPVDDIEAATARLTAAAISRHGPQHLPQRSGGATAFKFRDPDGHLLELIQFPDRPETGIDHSAIVVTDAARSIAFYRDTLGLRLAAQQLNTGPEQDRLDGLDGTSVEVVALQPQIPAPHVELLAYRSPPVRLSPHLVPADVAATRLVFEVASPPDPAVPLADGRSAALIEDPDGHKLLLVTA